MNIMPVMRTWRIVLPLFALVIGLARVAMAAPACNVRAKVPAADRIFAITNDLSTWREYPSIGDVPDLKLDSGMSVEVWQHRNKTRFVYIVQPGQDFWTYTRYCFDDEGQLESVGFEVNTPLGWGIRSVGTASTNGFDPSTVEFISLKSGRAIPKPPGVGDAPYNLKPRVYLTLRDLPFASLLAPPPKAAPRLSTIAAANPR